jgi:excisionase family DNA binding protein
VSAENRQGVPLAYSIAAAAAKADICRDTIYTAIRQGRLRAKKCGRRTLIMENDLHEFLAELPDLNRGT